MKSIEASPPLGVYFYPQSASCSVLEERAHEFGTVPWDDTLQVQQAKPLFEDHDQPRTYSAGPNGPNIWDDADPEVIAMQVELATEYGVDFFIYDTYVGNRDGKDASELVTPLRMLQQHGREIGLAPMLVLGASRVRLPVPNEHPLDYPEPGRNFDMDPASIELMVDFCAANYWDKDWTVYMQGDRPYVSIFGTSFLEGRPVDVQARYLSNFVEQFRILSDKKYGVDPYLVRVEKSAKTVPHIVGADFDAFTGYAMLPDFQDSHANPVQAYRPLVDRREEEWLALAGQSPPVVFVPPAVVGWDSSMRGEKGHTLDEVRGNYPFTPIVSGASAENFLDMASRAFQHTVEHVPPAEQYLLVCAWNEVGENCALLPRVIEGELDFSMLKALKKARDNISAVGNLDRLAI